MSNFGQNSPVFKALLKKGKDINSLFGALKTPCYVIDEEKLKSNCEKLSSVMKNCGCKILLAQKAFSN